MTVCETLDPIEKRAIQKALDLILCQIERSVLGRVTRLDQLASIAIGFRDGQPFASFDRAHIDQSALQASDDRPGAQSGPIEERGADRAAKRAWNLEGSGHVARSRRLAECRSQGHHRGYLLSQPWQAGFMR